MKYVLYNPYNNPTMNVSILFSFYKKNPKTKAKNNGIMGLESPTLNLN